MMENLSHGALETKKAPKRRFSLNWWAVLDSNQRPID